MKSIMSTTINQQPQTQNILETARSTGDFTTLIKAIEAAGLSETFRGQGSFTVFAPNDDAFRKLPVGTLDGLMKDLPKLKSILSYHVVDHRMTMNEMQSMTADGKTPSVTTLQGSPVVLKAQRNMLQRSEYVNDARIVKSDVGTSNGLIQIIDRVLSPT